MTPVMKQYETSLYFGIMTLSTTGFGEISPCASIERWYAIVILFLGAMTYSFIFGNVTALISDYDRDARDNLDRTIHLKAFLTRNGIPPQTQVHIWDVIKHTTNLHNRLDLTTILRGLPLSLKGEVASLFHKEKLTRLFGYNVEEQFLQMVAYELKWDIRAQGDFIIREGDVMEHVYFIHCGAAEILKKDVAVDMLGDHDTVDVRALVASPICRSDISVLALVDCDLFILERKRLMQILEKFPKVQAEIKDLAQKIPTFFNALGSDVNSPDVSNQHDGFTWRVSQIDE